MRLNNLFLFFAINLLNSQENISPKYKEDQIFFDFNFNFQLKNIEGYRQNGFSRSFNLGLLKDVSFNKKGNKGIAFGFGYGYTRLVNNLDIGQDSYFSINVDSALRNKLSFHSIQFPIELRLRTSTHENFEFWRFYFGYKLNYNFLTKYKPFFGRKTLLKNFVSEFTHCLSLSVGFNTWNIRFETGLSPIIKVLTNNTKTIKDDLLLSSVGLVFYIL